MSEKPGFSKNPVSKRFEIGFVVNGIVQGLVKFFAKLNPIIGF